MKIGTITFHWATNYGAVLQAYALQSHLRIKGYETEIINYIPSKLKVRRILSDIKNLNVKNLIKEYRINKFRKGNMYLSKEKYYSNSELLQKGHAYDVYICGSDQVWNEWFLTSSEKDINLSYYLNFVKENKTRISYATSFGTERLSPKTKSIVKPELEKFKSIGLRENTGKEILGDLGMDSSLVVDPTLLLEKKEYINLIEKVKKKEKFELFSYILHENQENAEQISSYIFEKYFDSRKDKKYHDQPIGVDEWLYSLSTSKFVLTNSFHGVVFSLIFHKPFIVVPVKGSKMNDRINTLLSAVKLKNRIIENFEKGTINELMAEKIDWESVDCKIKDLRRDSEQFLDKSLEDKVDFNL